LDAIVVGVDGAGGDDLALTSEEGGSLNTDAGLEFAIVSLVVIAVGDEV
jgi:hypothetical protein